jgi:hypothetical protein
MMQVTKVPFPKGTNVPTGTKVPFSMGTFVPVKKTFFIFDLKELVCNVNSFLAISSISCEFEPDQ